MEEMEEMHSPGMSENEDEENGEVSEEEPSNEQDQDAEEKEEMMMLKKIKKLAIGDMDKNGLEGGEEAQVEMSPVEVVKPKIRKQFSSDDECSNGAHSTDDSESEIKMAKTLCQLQGENVKLRRERDMFKRRAQCLIWENNLYLPLNQYKIASGKMDLPPDPEKRADIIGVSKEVLEQNQILKMGNSDMAERKALVGGTVREMGETFLAAVDRLGPIGLKEKRQTIRQEMERELEQKRKMKTFEEIKREVIQEAKNEHFMFQLRMNRIEKKLEDKYTPRSWVRGDYKVDWQHLEQMNVRRIRSMREGSYDMEVTHLEDCMG